MISCLNIAEEPHVGHNMVLVYKGRKHMVIGLSNALAHWKDEIGLQFKLEWDEGHICHFTVRVASQDQCQAQSWHVIEIPESQGWKIQIAKSKAI